MGKDRNQIPGLDVDIKTLKSPIHGRHHRNTALITGALKEDFVSDEAIRELLDKIAATKPRRIILSRKQNQDN